MSNIFIEKNDKFNTVIMQIRLSQKLIRENATKRALLPYVLNNGSKNYPNQTLINRRMDELYGATLSVGTSKKGNISDMIFTIRFVNPKIINNPDYTIKTIYDFLYEIIYNPKLEKDIFMSQAVNHEKNVLRDELLSQKEDKTTYAVINANERLYKGTTSAIRTDGYINEIDAITSEELYAYYNECLNSDECQIFVVGDVEENEVSFINLNRFNVLEKNLRITELNQDLPDEIIEKDEINQSVLCMYYDIKTFVGDDDYEKALIFNYVFGDSPASLLFKVIREQHGLCYSIRSSYLGANGLILINLGIAKEDFEKCKKLINEQIQILATNLILEVELQQAIKSMKNRYNAQLDSQSNYLTKLINEKIFNIKQTKEEFFAKLDAIKLDDIKEVAKKMTFKLTYFLKGEDHEEN